MKRGTSLIELMIAVALIGIAVALSGSAGGAVNSGGLVELQRQRATQALEHAAQLAAKGEKGRVEIEERLLESLPGAKLESKADAATTTLKISWKAPTGERESLSLTVLTAGGHR